MPTTLGDVPETLPGQPDSADLAAERAASAAEAAARAAQSAAGAVERLGARIAVFMSRVSQMPRAETKPGKQDRKRLKRQARKEAKAEQPGADVRWFPWVIGMSLGLLIG